jgi:hypothetical protein
MFNYWLFLLQWNYILFIHLLNRDYFLFSDVGEVSLGVWALCPPIL